MIFKKFFILIFLYLISLNTLWAQNQTDPIFPLQGPVSERVLSLDSQNYWTLKKLDQSAPLSVIPLEDSVVLSLSSGWLVLTSDLNFRSESLAWLSGSEIEKTQPALFKGALWAQKVGQGIYFLGQSSTPGILYPLSGTAFFNTAVILPQIDLMAVGSKSFEYIQSRRSFSQKNWNSPVKEDQPLPFFANDFFISSDGTHWGCDSLQAKPWRMDDGFWKPLDKPASPGRMTMIRPFPDQTGYFAGGSGWVGAFSLDGKRLWARDKDFLGKKLPPDIRFALGDGKIYLWSAVQRKVWMWTWSNLNPSGAVVGPTFDQLVQSARDLIVTYISQGNLPEALQVAGIGEKYADIQLASHPFEANLKTIQAEFLQLKQVIKRRIVGNGSLTVNWSTPYAKPLADWTWTPDASVDDGQTAKVWQAESITVWEGRFYEPRRFRLASAAEKTPWPGATDFLYSSLQFPSWVNVFILPPVVGKAPLAEKKSLEEEDQILEDRPSELGWYRIMLPMPTQPYDLPVE